MSSARGKVSRCPLCGTRMERDLSDDHVFGEAFGAKRTVRTHRRCNNNVSQAAEGALHASNSIFNVLRGMHGRAKLPVEAETVSGQAMQLDLASGKLWPAKPKVSVCREAGQVNLTAAGTEEQVRAAVATWRRKWPSIPPYNELPTEALQAVQVKVDRVNIAVDWQLPAAEQFAVKAALGAGVLAYGPDFASTAMAQALRDWASKPFDNPLVADTQATGRPRMELAAIQATSDSLQRLVPERSWPDMEAKPGSEEYQALFMPMPRGTQRATAVFIHLLGTPVLPWGIVLPASLPHGRYGPPVAPLLVRETGGRMQIVHYTEVVLDLAVEKAEEAKRQLREELEAVDALREGA